MSVVIITVANKVAKMCKGLTEINDFVRLVLESVKKQSAIHYMENDGSTAAQEKCGWSENHRRE